MALVQEKSDRVTRRDPNAVKAVVAALAAKFGLKIRIVEPRDLPLLAQEQADLIVDWDYLPDDCRKQLLNVAAFSIVAIHGYNINDDLAAFLVRGGIICPHWLDDKLFAELASAETRAA